MKYLTCIFTVFLCLAALVAADYAQVRKDIEDINKQAVNMRSALEKTDGNSLPGALSIASASSRLDNAIVRGTRDVKANNDKPTDAEVTETFKALSPMGDTVEAISKRLIALHDNFKKLGVAGIAKNSVTQAATHSKEFGDALTDKAPEERKKDAKALGDRVNAALNRAVEAYARD